MKMKVICAGLSKTGTSSLTKALRILGYTVHDYYQHRYTDTDEWLDIYCEGKEPDFASMYQNVDAVIGLPTSFWFEEIFHAFPDAKVVLSLRGGGEEDWVKSWATENELLQNPGLLTRFTVRWFSRAIHRKGWLFVDVISVAAYGTLNSKSTVLAKKKYREHNERVKAVIPKEKLLIYNVKQGWNPLCEFLGCDVPDQEFPRVNVGSSLTHGIIARQLCDVDLKYIILAGLVFLVSISLYLWYL